MAKPKAKAKESGRAKEKEKEEGRPRPDKRWTALTWDDLEDWAGSRSVERGRSYQRSGRVQNLRITGDGALLATVQGTLRYATTVALASGRGRALESSCTCPVGADGCKHAVAVVADFLQAIADGRDVPRAAEDDPRLKAIEDEAFDDWDEDDEGDEDEDDEGWDDYEEESMPPVRRARVAGRPARTAEGGNWDDRIEQHLRAKSHDELADLVWSLTQRFPEVYQEFRERLALQDGNVSRLLADARREIRKVTSEPAWQDRWGGDGHIPNYDPIRHRLERLLDLGHADEVVSLGRDLLREGLRQVGEAHDEGETSMALGECLDVVFRAVAQSSLPAPERILFAIDAVHDDEYDTIGEGIDVILEAPHRPEDWSAVADALARRLEPREPAGTSDRDREESSFEFSRNYRRDGLTGWIARALHEAGREAEVRALYESEARITGSYERFVNFLVEAGDVEAATRWAKEGIEATRAKLPGIASHLAATLCELARKRRRWDVVAAHAARTFFERPSPGGFDALIEAARKAKVEEPVRAAALRFLETGVAPYRVVAPKPAPKPVATRKSASRTAKKAPAPPPAAPPPAAPKLIVDPSWPLPIPDELVPILSRPDPYDRGPSPHLDVLLEMAMISKRPDDVLRWYDAMRAAPRREFGYAYDSSTSYAERVAAAVRDAYPERSIEIYTAAMNAQLPRAEPRAYEAVVGYLKKLRPIYDGLNRGDEWTDLVVSIREKYRNRPKFMELLDRLDNRPIVASVKPQRR